MTVPQAIPLRADPGALHRDSTRSLTRAALAVSLRALSLSNELTRADAERHRRTGNPRGERASA